MSNPAEAKNRGPVVSMGSDNFAAQIPVENPLAREFETFEANRQRLLGTDRGRWALVKGDHILDTFDTARDATHTGWREFGDTSFLVRRIQEVETVEHFIGIREFMEREAYLFSLKDVLVKVLGVKIDNSDESGMS